MRWMKLLSYNWVQRNTAPFEPSTNLNPNHNPILNSSRTRELSVQLDVSRILKICGRCGRCGVSSDRYNLLIVWLFDFLLFLISCLLWRPGLRWYGVWVYLGSKGLVCGLGYVGFHGITLRQLHQRYQLSPAIKSLGECFSVIGLNKSLFRLIQWSLWRIRTNSELYWTALCFSPTSLLQRDSSPPLQRAAIAKQS